MNNYSKLDYRAIGERIKQLRGEENQTDFAKKFDLSQIDISRIERGEVKPTPEFLFNICLKHKKELSWLLTGKGEPPHGKEAIVHKEGAHFAGQFTEVDVFILAGAGSPKDLAESEPIDHIIIPHNFHSPSIIPIKIRGRSMEPLIFDGAYVGVDKSDREVISGEIYALWIPYEGAVIKRLFVEVDKIIVKSENPIFPTYPIAFKDIHNDNFILGRVKWIIQKL